MNGVQFSELHVGGGNGDGSGSEATGASTRSSDAGLKDGSSHKSLLALGAAGGVLVHRHHRRAARS